MPPHTALIVPWLVFSITGQWCLVLLLITYACATRLPQRSNPYLVNFIVTTFVATIPTSLLFYTGHLYSAIPSSLCLAQAALVDGVSPMFATAQLALVFDAWSELRSLCIHKGHVSRNTFVKCIALIAPYFAFGSFTFVASLAGLSNEEYKTPLHPPVDFVFCKTHGQLSTILATAYGIFMIILTAIQVLFEVWVAWIIYAYPTKVQGDRSTWRTCIHFALRVITLSMLQLVTVFLIVANGTHNDIISRVTDMLASMSMSQCRIHPTNPLS
ncbi:hypothetical protein JB92DRAFT_1839392 [Gautieria morchelliformis]|nr:hypothetical protein JB92DRAFT_1839392 [Gautieria morchelliformis]